MGGFHLVEPPEGCSGTSPKANTGTDKRAASDSVESSSTLVDMDAENRCASANDSEPKILEGRVTILTLGMLRKLLKDPDFKIDVKEDEIMDKSKGDAMSRFIFIMQSSWFILHCIARHVQGLGLTQIELTTVGLASLNGITLLLWWHKPLGAQTPVRVYVKRKLTDAERKTNVSSEFCQMYLSCWFDLLQWQRRQRWRKSGWSSLIPKMQEGRLTIIRDIALCRRELV